MGIPNFIINFAKISVNIPNHRTTIVKNNDFFIGRKGFEKVITIAATDMITLT